MEVIVTADIAGEARQHLLCGFLSFFLCGFVIVIAKWPIVMSIELFVPAPQEHSDIRVQDQRPRQGTLYDTLNVLRSLPCCIEKEGIVIVAKELGKFLILNFNNEEFLVLPCMV